MKALLALPLFASLAFSQKAPKIAVVQTNRAVCEYLSPIVMGMPCRQAVTVAIKSDDSSSEAFKVTLTYRDAKGAVKTDTRIAMPTKKDTFMDASVTYFLDDITVISAVAVPLVSGGEAGKFPQN